MTIEENPILSMGKAWKITRKSIHTFLQNYQHFTTVAAFIALPFSITLLISQALVPRSFTLLPTVYGRLNTIFNLAGFPNSSAFFSLLTLKLSQTISTSVLTLPFAISFLLLTKASIIHYFIANNNSKSQSFFSLYHPLLITHLCNAFVIFAANATCFATFFLTINFFEDLQLNSGYWVLFLTAAGAVFYSVVLANAIVVCNLALICSGAETCKRSSGFTAILRACVIIKGKTTTALALAVPINLGLAAVEALFHYRIVRPNDHVVVVAENGAQLWLVAVEGVFIAYLYSILLVLEVVMTCFFYKTCITGDQSVGLCDDVVEDELEIEELGYYKNVDVEKLKALEDFV